MQVRDGVTEEWLVASATGRVVGAYEKEEAARRQLAVVHGRKLFHRQVSVVEVEHP